MLVLVMVTSLQLWITQDRTDQKTAIEPLAGLGDAQIGGAFTLTDHTGKTVRDTDFRGQLLLVYFGFTQCPDMCPATLLMLTKAMQVLGDKANQVTPLFISIDPERDTPEVLKNFLSNFDKRIVGLTGTAAQVKQAQDAYKVYAAKKEIAEKKGDYSVDHSSYLYVMGKDGKFLAVLPSTASEQEVAHAVSRYLSQ